MEKDKMEFQSEKENSEVRKKKDFEFQARLMSKIKTCRFCGMDHAGTCRRTGFSADPQDPYFC